MLKRNTVSLVLSENPEVGTLWRIFNSKRSSHLRQKSIHLSTCAHALRVTGRKNYKQKQPRTTTTDFYVQTLC